MFDRVLPSILLLGVALPCLGADHLHKNGTPPPGRFRCIPHTHERAGYPLELSSHAAPTVDPTGKGYYVGGGTPLIGGEGRCRQDGTWGWDETGSNFLPRFVRLQWSHGRRYQGGTGSYAVDRPHGPLRRALPMLREVGN